MNRVSKSETRRQASGSTLVIFENPVSREQAVRFCEQMSPQEEGPVAQWFSFSDLKNPAVGRKALKKAAEVEVVVFAICAAGDFPSELKLWMENWIGKRAEREGMLIGLVTGERTSPRDAACLKEVYLRHVAHRAGMDYLSHIPQIISRKLPDLLDSLNERQGQVTSVLDEILHTNFVPPTLPLR